MISLYFLPIISAFIGWITNLVAVKMLFHPREEKRFLGIRIQGVFPKRQRALAKKLGEIVSTELLSVKDIQGHLKKTATSPEALVLITSEIEKVILEKLPKIVPMIAMVLNANFVSSISRALAEDLKSGIEEIIESLSKNLEEDINVHRIVEEKVIAFSSDKLEELLNAIMKREFRFIEYIGAVLGFIIGLLQVLLIQYEDIFRFLAKNLVSVHG